jgi:aspartyl-tRNA(Asn)/glutamyl-tRNA(Gln) amidotransferase subunit A
MHFHLWSLEETLDALEKKTCSAKELTDAFLKRIHQHNPTLHAYITVSERALWHAEQIDSNRPTGKGTQGPLAGVPISIKDLLDTKDMKTTYGSRHFENHVPSEDATAVQILRNADAVIIGKTNLHEYAYGTTNENPHYGKTLNPWNRAKIPGGSSGGSAASVCAGLAVASIGTDTGGSIRIPAALTGVVGLKPTYGLISKSGVFPLADSLDHVGPITKTVRDAGILLNLLAGQGSHHTSSLVQEKTDYLDGRFTCPIRVGIPRQFFFDKCHPGVLQTVLAGLRVLESSFIQTIDVDIPNIDLVPEAQNIILSAEALYVHQDRLETHPDWFGSDIRQRLLSSNGIPAADYVKAIHFKQQFQRSVNELFDEVDVIVTPTTPLLATDVGQTKAPLGVQNVPVGRHLTRYTNPWNFSGLPAISIPCGSSSGLPVGMQLVSAPFHERKLLAIAAQFEQVFRWTSTAPDYQ